MRNQRQHHPGKRLSGQTKRTPHLQPFPHLPIRRRPVVPAIGVKRTSSTHLLPRAQVGAKSSGATVLNCHSSALHRGMLPSGGVDVVVTELVDSGLLGEHIVPVLRHAATLLKPDGQLPVSVRASLSFDQSVGRSPQGRSSRSRPQCGQRPSRPLRCDLARLFPPSSLTRPPHSHAPPHTLPPSPLTLTSPKALSGAALGIGAETIAVANESYSCCRLAGLAHRKTSNT